MWAIPVLLATVLPLPAAGSVSLPPGATEGVRWAADRLSAAAPGVKVSCALTPKADLGAEGFRLSGNARVEAAGWPGLMYGLLELDRRAKRGEDLRAARTPADRPGLAFRAVARYPGLWLHIPLYDDCNRGAEPHDHATNWWFHDENHWRETFRTLARERVNGIILLHPLLFPGFIDYSARYPEATYLPPDELAAKQKALRMAIRLGHEYNITLHWLRWNIWIPYGYAKAHGLEQSGVDTEATRELEAWSTAEFYRTFPGFGSMISICGETPPGCIDFIADGTVRGLRRVTPRPTFVVWNWCANPPDINRIIRAYDGPTSVMHYLQYEQLFCDRADPRIAAFSRATGNAPMIALGGPKAAQSYLFWSDPQWARGLMHTLAAGHAGWGIGIEFTDPPERWLGEEAFAHYAWATEEPYRPERWVDAIAERYGRREVAAPLLSAMEAASRITARQVMLIHSQTDHYMPQLGLSLQQCVEMPSITDYIFENTVESDKDGYLTPRLGLCWPSSNYDWGERVVPIREYALGKLPAAKRTAALADWIASRRAHGFASTPPRPGDTEPPAIAAELDDLARRAETGADEVERLGAPPLRADELTRVLRMIRLNAALGRYYAARDRSALAWEMYRALGVPEQKQTALAEIAATATAWERYATLLKGMCGAQVSGYVSAVAKPPPWGQLDFWYGYRGGTWRIDDLTARWQREAEILTERLNTWPREKLEGPTFDELRTLAADAQPVATFDFEQADDPRFRVLTNYAPDAAVTRDPKLVLDGAASLLVDSRRAEGEWSTIFETLPAAVHLEAGATYQVSLKYRVLDSGEARYSEPFGMAFRSEKGGVPSDRGDARTWGGQPGGEREHILQATLADFDDYHLFLSTHGRAAMVVDDLRIVKVASAPPR